MTILTVVHSTVYRYRRPVGFGEHRLMFRPRDSHDMRLIDTGLVIEPPAAVHWLHDVFNNSIAIARFDGEHECLRFQSTITIDRRTRVHTRSRTTRPRCRIWSAPSNLTSPTRRAGLANGPGDSWQPPRPPAPSNFWSP